MLKKRIIFTLLYDSGSFVLSRNFRLQNVGDLGWLEKNYNFKQISSFIDELVVLDVTRNNRDINLFSDMLKKLTSECFVPIAAGGGVRSCEDARLLLRSGADKVVLNSIIYKDYNMVKIIAKEFGQQCVIGSIDLMNENDAHSVLINNGTEKDSKFNLSWIYDDYVGEVYLNSINRDGTGQGYDFSTLNEIPKDCKLPIILAGGVGNSAHLKEGLLNQRVDAVATAHLFNFIGNGLQNARNSIIASKIPLAKWPPLNKIIE